MYMYNFIIRSHACMHAWVLVTNIYYKSCINSCFVCFPYAASYIHRPLIINFKYYIIITCNNSYNLRSIKFMIPSECILD